MKVKVLVAQLCPTLCNPMDCRMPGFPVAHHLLEFAQVRVHWIGDVTHPCHPLWPSSSAFSLTQHQGLFQWVSCSHRVALVLELQLQHQFYSGLISFKTDWFGLLAFHGTLKSLLQQHGLTSSILWHSAFFMIQLSYLYMTTGKTIAFTVLDLFYFSICWLLPFVADC